MVSYKVNFPCHSKRPGEALQDFMGLNLQGQVFSGEPNSLARMQCGSRSMISLWLILLRDTRSCHVKLT